MSWLTAFAAAIQVGSSTPQVMESGAWLASFFNEVCFAPFGQKDGVQRAVEQSQTMTFRLVEARAGVPQTGVTWEAPKASVSYTDAEWLPRDLPSPQCTLSLEAERSFDHLQSVGSLEATLSIGAGRTKGKNGIYQTEWNFVGPQGQKRRMFLKSSSGGNGFAVTVSLLDLRK